MGFGTGAEVDYTTLSSMVAKGKTLSTPQVFHGDNAGTIDKFYTNALARTIGFTGVIDPVLELFAGEHAHIDFKATTADDIFLITAQGMDFDDHNWTFHLHGPGGYMAYGDGANHPHISIKGHDGCMPHITATRGNGRLSLVLQRNNTDNAWWVGNWRLMVAYKALSLDAMVMPTIGELILPVSAGPVHGPRFSRLLLAPKIRRATRNLKMKPAHRLDIETLSTNHNDGEACSVVLNIYGRTRLQMELLPQISLASAGSGFKAEIVSDVLLGNIVSGRTFARLIAPSEDIHALVANVKRKQVPKAAILKGQDGLRFDPARVLAALEKQNPKVANVRDEEVQVADHNEGFPHVHIENTDVPGVYHLSVYVEGTYCPEHSLPQGGHVHDQGHDHGTHSADGSICGPECNPESFSRLLSAVTAVVKEKERKPTKKKKLRRK